MPKIDKWHAIVLIPLLGFLWFVLQSITGGLFYDSVWGLLTAHGFQKGELVAEMAQYLGPLVISAIVLAAAVAVGRIMERQNKYVVGQGLPRSIPEVRSPLPMQDLQKNAGHEETPSTNKKRHDPPPNMDTRLADAVIYAIEGRWFGPREKLPTEGEFFAGVGMTSVQMIELASKGKLSIWGKSSPAHPHELIPIEYWKGHALDFGSTFFGGKRDNIKTKRVQPGTSNQKYERLMVCRQEIEKLWPQ